MADARYHRAADVARRLAVHRRTVLKWVDAGHFPGALVLPGSRGDIRIPAADVQAFEVSRRINPCRLVGADSEEGTG